MDKDCYVPDCRAHNKDEGKTAILIGGSFHRQRIKVNNHQCVMRMPLAIDFMATYEHKDTPFFHELKTEVYRRVASVYGIEGIFPDHLFLYEQIDPVQFLKNLLLDYLG